jgi:hypothetical protein
MKKPSLFVLLIGIVAVVFVSMAGAAGAAQPPHPPHPVHPPHPGSNPTVGTTTVDVPITCTFGPGSPTAHETAHVSVTSPSNTNPNAPYDASFLLTIDDLIAPADVASFTITSTYNLSGPVSPNGALSFTQEPQSFPAGSEPTFSSFTQTLTPGHNGTISYRFDDVSYDFAFGGTDNIHADCTLDNGPVDISQTNI